MKKRANIQKTKRRRVTFSYEAPHAAEVMLMGDFNNWNSKKHPMKNDGDGVWTKYVLLSPGDYEYKFLVDGDWKTDPHNDKKCVNCYGTYNNVISVPLN